MAEHSVDHVNTAAMYDAVKAFDTAVVEYEKRVNDMKNSVNALLNTWEGFGKDEFKKDYVMFSSQLTDLMDVLMDLREGLVEAENAFIEADSTLSKEMACAAN